LIRRPFYTVVALSAAVVVAVVVPKELSVFRRKVDVECREHQTHVDDQRDT